MPLRFAVKVCIVGMTNMEVGNNRRKNLSKILLAKPLPLTNDVSTPSEFLLGNHLNDKIGIFETSQKNVAGLFQFSLLHKFKKPATIFEKP